MAKLLWTREKVPRVGRVFPFFFQVTRIVILPGTNADRIVRPSGDIVCVSPAPA